MIYLDNSATTQPDPSVINSFNEVTKKYFANPSSIHQLGGEVEKLLDRARTQVATLLEVNADEVIFTSGGTEGNNLAIKGIAFANQSRGKHIITSQIEHPSVLEACESLESLGFEVTYLPVNQAGSVSMEDLEKAIRKDTVLVSIMHVNNEMGTIQPIQQIGELLKKYPKIFFHVDGVQGLGKVPLSLKDSYIDLCTFSGHKIHGLKGTGVMYIRNGTSLYPLFHGGNQEFGIRSGTENVAGIVAFARALRIIKEKEQNQLESLKHLNAYLREKLQKIERIVINSPKEAAPHIFNFSLPGMKPEVLIHTLSEANIYVSTKSACSSKQQDASAVLIACGYDQARASSGIRVSLSYEHTLEEIKQFVKLLKVSIQNLTKVMS